MIINSSKNKTLIKIIWLVFLIENFTPFSVSAFLKKRVDYSHGFSGVFFFDTPEVTKIVLPKVLQNFKKTPNCTS